jgi:hypothetical protein
MNMRTLTLLLIGMLALPSPAWAIEGLSGSTWGMFLYEMRSGGPSGVSALGWIRLGIDWRKRDDYTLSTFAQIDWRFQSNREGNEFFNAFGPTVGLSIEKKPFRFGLGYKWERYPERDFTDNRAIAFIEWYHGWDLMKKGN